MSKELSNKEQAELSTHVEPLMGYEDESEGDLIVPRVKVMQALSPEVKEKIADEGQIINSLTHDKLNGQVFIPVFKFNNNIWWKPRADGGGIRCMARDGKVGIPTDGSPSLICSLCRKNEFDNSKQGREAIPVCTKYMNFFGYFRDTQIPIILSFSKTNYNEGKKLFTLAKVSMQNMWNNGYVIKEKLVRKGGNEWYIIDPIAAGPTTQDERMQGRALYENFRNRDLNFDIDETTGEATPDTATKEEVDKAEY